MEEERTSLEFQMVTRDSTINSWLMTFDQIEKELNVIKQKEDLITFKSSDVEFSKERKEQILEDIKLINTLLENNKKRISQLSAQLKKSGGEITGLQNMIANLEASIVQREEEISGLKLALVEKDFEMGQLNNQMTELQVTVTQQTETINTQIEEMNKAYLAYGTYRDLRDKGIVTKEGGFLGLGKREALIEDSPDSLFTRVDITETRLIPVNSKDAKLITSHPSGSYEIIAEGENMIAGIEIKDPDEFWKISRYAVVEIIK
jgi:tRNA splicing endonuclease